AFNDLDLPKNTLLQHQEYWYSHLHHSQFVATSKEELERQIQVQDAATQLDLSTCDYLIFSFGTAKVYEHKSWGHIVANCHKLPNQEFENHLLNPKLVINRYLSFLKKLKGQNNKIKVLFTLSPVRHIRDGIVENQRSKAILLTAIHEICEQLEFAYYFPSYELLMDDLRDYRFYERDLVHPSKQAIDYIWEYFQQCFFDTSTQQIHQQIKAFQQAAAHRPFRPSSAAHQKFVLQQIEKIEQFQEKYTFLNLEKELARFRAQLV
ncbi:MAG: GSCFA domain-containing protein, partial [Bacteroidota bacterium]